MTQKGFYSYFILLRYRFLFSCKRFSVSENYMIFQQMCNFRFMRKILTCLKSNSKNLFCHSLFKSEFRIASSKNNILFGLPTPNTYFSAELPCDRIELLAKRILLEKDVLHDHYLLINHHILKIGKNNSLRIY